MSVTFTIFIPTYNRAYILPKAFASIEQQNIRDFEVLVMDDGSTDNTRELVEEWSRTSGIPVRYYWHENRGTQRVWNHALTLAQGEFFVYLDSDNMLTPNSLEKIQRHWNSIAPDQRATFAGIEGLFAYPDGRVEGDRFPADVVDATFIEMRHTLKIRGDKGGTFRVDVARRFPYPEIEGERHVRPTTIWKRMTRAGLKFRYINEVLQIVDRQADGKSANRFPLRMKNPKGFRLYYMEDLNLPQKDRPVRDLLRNAAEYTRYSLHAGVGFRQQARDIDRRLPWLIALPRGIGRWFADWVRLRTTKRLRP